MNVRTLPRSGPQSSSALADQPSERTILAYERTYTAWLRTGLAALGAGLAVQALRGHGLEPWLVKLVSTALLVISALVSVAGTWCDRLAAIEAAPGLRTVPRALRQLLNLALVGLSLASLVGVWAR